MELLGSVGLCGRRKTRGPGQRKTLTKQGRKPRTKSTHLQCQVRELNSGCIGRREVLPPQCYPCSTLFLVLLNLLVCHHTSVFPAVIKSFLGELAACELRSTLFIYKLTSPDKNQFKYCSHAASYTN